MKLARLSSSMPAADSPEYWPQLLHAKVLKYLIRRYAARDSWNRHAQRMNASSIALQPNSGKDVSDSLVVQEGAGRPPKGVQVMRQALQRVSDDNVASYNAFEIPQNRSEDASETRLA